MAYPVTQCDPAHRRAALPSLRCAPVNIIDLLRHLCYQAFLTAPH